MLRHVVAKNDLPGVASETSRDAGSCHEILLQGPPWSQNSSYNLVMKKGFQIGTYRKTKDQQALNKHTQTKVSHATIFLYNQTSLLLKLVL